MLVSFLSFYQARAILKKELTRDMQTLSQTVANDVTRMMFERVQNVTSWSQLAIMQEIRIDDVDKRLSTFLQELQLSYDGVYQTIYVIDTQNKIIASSDSHQLNKTSVLSKPWFNHKAFNYLTNHPSADKLTRQVVKFNVIRDNILEISQDIRDDNSNEVIGQLVAEFNWQYVQGLINTAVRKPSAAALLDENKQVLAATSNWKTETGYEIRAISSFNPQSITPKWQVRVEKLHSVAVEPVHRLGYVFLALLASTLLLAAFLVTPIAQAITRPLAKLTAFVRSFKQGQFVETPKYGPPEVQELSVAFESMMQDLAKTQANLTRAAKLAVVGEMAAAMSHEVRTPLGILRSSADLLLREPALSKDGKEVLGFIISETERLNKLVSTLIDSARPRAPVFVATDIRQLILNAVALLRMQAAAKNVDLTVESTEKLQLEIDYDQMTQVMMNLLMNAIQVLPEGGKVQVTWYKKIVNERELAFIEIVDDGPGISADNQAQIFEPFFTQRTGGVGLGLAIVRQIVQAHQGEIVCTSHQFSSNQKSNKSGNQMNGAQFTISLPIKMALNE